MIKFKEFVEVIHRAVSSASDSLLDRNREVLEKYFDKEDGGNGTTTGLKPKMVEVEYPIADADGGQAPVKVSVPLITLVPMQSTRIEKVTLTAEFGLMEEDGEVVMDLSERKRLGRGRHGHTGKVEIVITPDETPESLRSLIEGYERELRRHIM